MTNARDATMTRDALDATLSTQGFRRSARSTHFDPRVGCVCVVELERILAEPNMLRLPDLHRLPAWLGYNAFGCPQYGE